jgi:hypothetical protein
MTIDKPVLTEADRVSRPHKMALQPQKISDLERRHADGYARHPVQPQEFAIAETDLAWGDAGSEGTSFDSELLN